MQLIPCELPSHEHSPDIASQPHLETAPAVKLKLDDTRVKALAGWLSTHNEREPIAPRAVSPAPLPIAIRLEPNIGAPGWHWHLRTDYALSERSGFADTPANSLRDIITLLEVE